MPQTSEQVLLANGFSRERLLKLCRRIANDERVAKPCRIYDLRSTFASNALAAGVTVFELARIMGTSVPMVEHHYGALIDGAHAGIVGRLDAIASALEEDAEEAS